MSTAETSLTCRVGEVTVWTSPLFGSSPSRFSVAPLRRLRGWISAWLRDQDRVPGLPVEAVGLERVQLEGDQVGLELRQACPRLMESPERRGVVDPLRLREQPIQPRAPCLDAPPSRSFRASFDAHPRLTSGGLELRLCPRVHLKLVIVDGAQLYLGSANWTGAGLGAKGSGRRNFELGMLSDDPQLLDHVQALYDRIWRGAECRRCRLRERCEAPLDT